MITLCRQSDTSEKELDFYISNDEETFARLQRSTPIGSNTSAEFLHVDIEMRQARVPAGYGLYVCMGSDGTSSSAYCDLKFTYHLYPTSLTYLSQGKAYCHGKKIPETTLKVVCASVIGIQDYCSDTFTDRIERIEVPKDNHLRFIFKDGEVDERIWADRSRRDSWTEEMKQAARERRKNQCQEQ